MKQVSSRVAINRNAINALKKNAIAALEMTGDYILDSVVEAQVMPFDKGTLQNESTFVDKKKSSQGNVRIVSSTPYARRLYFHPEYNFQTVNNPNAKGKWLEDWTETGKYAKEVKQAYAIFLEQLGGM